MNRDEAEKELLALLQESEENCDEYCTPEEVEAMLEEHARPENQVYLTGDTHGRFDRIVDFCRRQEVEPGNILIILGDAGLNYYGGRRDERSKARLAKEPITFFCIHGNHEMRPSEDLGYEQIEYHGGKVWCQLEYPNILFAIDGEIYDFNGCSCLVIGGAYSVDKYYRLQNGWNWFPDEQPSEEVKARVEGILENRGWKVDIVLSHTAPLKYEPTEVFLPMIDQSTVDKSTEEWLDTIEERLEYERWYCGHYHTEKEVDKLRFMFNDYAVIPRDSSIESERKWIRKMRRQAEMAEAIELLEDAEEYTYYSVLLSDYALPGFCSGTKEYCATEDVILRVLEGSGTEREDLIQAAKSYFAGTGDGKGVVLYSEEQFLAQLLYLGEESLSISNFTHTHHNIWGFEYWMRAKRMDCRFVYVMDRDGKYRRAFQLAFTNLEYTPHEPPNECWTELSEENAWGHPGVLIDSEPSVLQNQLLIFDRVFDKKEDVQKDMDSPAEIDYRRFFDEIFADG